LLKELYRIILIGRVNLLTICPQQLMLAQPPALRHYDAKTGKILYHNQHRLY